MCECAWRRAHESLDPLHVLRLHNHHALVPEEGPHECSRLRGGAQVTQERPIDGLWVLGPNPVHGGGGGGMGVGSGLGNCTHSHSA
jgi:hypothetical protein